VYWWKEEREREKEREGGLLIRVPDGHVVCDYIGLVGQIRPESRILRNDAQSTISKVPSKRMFSYFSYVMCLPLTESVLNIEYRPSPTTRVPMKYVRVESLINDRVEILEGHYTGIRMLEK
jgi:hypothetical protein